MLLAFVCSGWGRAVTLRASRRPTPTEGFGEATQTARMPAALSLIPHGEADVGDRARFREDKNFAPAVTAITVEPNSSLPPGDDRPGRTVILVELIDRSSRVVVDRVHYSFPPQQLSDMRVDALTG